MPCKDLAAIFPTESPATPLNPHLNTGCIYVTTFEISSLTLYSLCSVLHFGRKQRQSWNHWQFCLWKPLNFLLCLEITPGFQNILRCFWWESLMRVHGLIHWPGFLTSFHMNIPIAVWQVIWREGWYLAIVLSSELLLIYFPQFILIKQKKVCTISLSRFTILSTTGRVPGRLQPQIPGGVAGSTTVHGWCAAPKPSCLKYTFNPERWKHKLHFRIWTTKGTVCMFSGCFGKLHANPNVTPLNTAMELSWFGNRALTRMLIENFELILLCYHFNLPNFSYAQKITKKNPLVLSQPNLLNSKIN